MPSGKAAAAAANPDTPTDPPTTTTAPSTEDTAPRWRYTSDEALIYTNVPVTPKRGDVVAWPGNPGVNKDGLPITVPGPPADDGRWESTTDPVTRWPDNHQKTKDAAEAAQVKAALAALAQKEG